MSRLDNGIGINKILSNPLPISVNEWHRIITKHSLWFDASVMRTVTAWWNCNTIKRAEKENSINWHSFIKP